MKFYTVHVRRHGLDPDRDFVLVPEGFSFWAFLLTALWALWHRLWLAALAFAVLQGFVAWGLYALGANAATGMAADIAVAVAAGLFGNDLRRRKLARQGFVEEGVVAARNLGDAERRYLDDHPDLAAVMADGAVR